MTKADVIAKIAEKTGIDKADVAQSLETFFGVVKEALVDGEPVYVRGFGSFVNKKRAKKVARNISKKNSESSISLSILEYLDDMNQF